MLFTSRFILDEIIHSSTETVVNLKNVAKEREQKTEKILQLNIYNMLYKLKAYALQHNSKKERSL